MVVKEIKQDINTWSDRRLNRVNVSLVPKFVYRLNVSLSKSKNRYLCVCLCTCVCMPKGLQIANIFWEKEEQVRRNHSS